MEEEKIPFSFGFIESPSDYRDIPLSAVAEIPKVFPDSFEVDISKLPVWNQKSIGSCIGQASTKKKQLMELQETKEIIPLSPRFVYALCKSIDGYPGEGTYYRLAGKVLQDYGCATEATLVNNCDLTHAEYIDLKHITGDAYDEARQYAIKGYTSVNPNNLDDLRNGIMQGGVLLGMKLDRNWWTDKNGRYSWKPEDILPLRVPNKILSGHAVFAYKWDTVDGRVRIWIRNSWSEEWGLQGNGYFIWDEYSQFHQDGYNGLIEGWTYVDLPNDWIKEVKDLPKFKDFKHYFAIDLEKGQRSEEVRTLQIALKMLKHFPATQQATGYYGDITQLAVMEFQYKYQVASVDELHDVSGSRVGKKTRAKLNEIFNK